MNMTVAGHAIRFEHPQQLLMLEATRTLDGTSVKVLHESGHEADEGSFRLVSRSSMPSTSDEVRGDAEAAAVSLPPRYFAELPLLAHVDIWSPPAQYRTVPARAIGQFEFNHGEEYSVVIVSNASLVQMTVVAK